MHPRRSPSALRLFVRPTFRPALRLPARSVSAAFAVGIALIVAATSSGCSGTDRSPAPPPSAGMATANGTTPGGAASANSAHQHARAATSKMGETNTPNGGNSGSGTRSNSGNSGTSDNGSGTSGSSSGSGSGSSANNGVSAVGNSVPAAEAVYDLEADRAKRAAAAKAELGPRTMTTVVSDIFVVVGPPGWQGNAFEQSVSLMKSSMQGYLNNRFGKKPSHAISVYLFAEGHSYEAFCKKQYNAPCIAHYGFYSPSDRYMVMNAGLGLGTLTHEIVHPLVEADFPNAPTWLNEGIASVFEAPVITKPGEIHGVKNWRHPRLKRAMTSASEKSNARLDTLFGMADTTFRGDGEDLNYALARYVCQWLDEKGKLWPFYQKWRDNAATDPHGTKAFEEVLGMTPSAANELWSKWALAL